MCGRSRTEMSRFAGRPDRDGPTPNFGRSNRTPDCPTEYRPIIIRGQELGDAPSFPPRHPDAHRDRTVHR
jgi:hypothetical protein